MGDGEVGEVGAGDMSVGEVGGGVVGVGEAPSGEVGGCVEGAGGREGGTNERIAWRSAGSIKYVWRREFT